VFKSSMHYCKTSIYVIFIVQFSQQNGYFRDFSLKTAFFCSNVTTKLMKDIHYFVK